MTWYLWVLLVALVWPPCYIWLVRFILSLEAMYNPSSKLVLFICFICIPIAIPICLGMLIFGAIFHSLVWVTNRG